MVFELGFDEAGFRSWRRPLFVALRRYQDPGQIERRFPALLTTYMAYAGTFLYDGGEYWSSLHPALKIHGPRTGHHFMRAVHALGLEPFDRIVTEERALTWVSRILAQGGIPRSCLQPFAELVTREVNAGVVDGRELVSAWRTRGATLAQLHAPTRRFVLYGGEEVVGLLDRCIELLQEGARTGQTPAGADVGLPQYVADAFGAADRGSARRVLGRREGVVRPQLRLEPYDGLGPVVVLPAVGTEQVGGTWRVQTGDRVHRHQPSTYAAETVKVPPAAAAEVEFLSRDGVRHRWIFDVLASQRTLFFDPGSQRLVRDPTALATDEIWALAPAASAFRSGDEAVREIQRLPEPTGAWAGFAIRHLDLRDLHSLVIDDGHGGTHTVPVMPPRARPQLEGARLDGVLAEGDAPIYTSMPALRVPSAANGLRWDLQLSGPDGELRFTAAAGSDGLIALPEASFGVFRLRARGPIGGDLTTRFAVVTNLRVARPTEVALPGGEPARVTLAAPGIGIGDGEPGAAVEIEPAMGDATVVLAPLHAPDGRTMTVSVAIARLLWTIVHDTKPALQAGSRVVRVDAEEFDDHLADTLVVSTGRPGVALALELRDREGVPLHALPAITTVGEAGRWAFNLAPFAGTIQAASGARMSLHLAVGTRRVHAATIVAAAHVHGLHVSCDQQMVSATFTQDRIVSDRVLRLWPALQPWTEPIRIPVPDGETRVRAPAEARLTPGPYLAEVVVEDPWTTAVRPSALSPTVRQLTVGDRDQMREWFATLDPSEPLTLVSWVLGPHRGETQFAIEALAGRASETAIALRSLLDDTAIGQPSGKRFDGLASVASARDTILAEVISAARELEGQEQWLDRLDLRLLEHVNPTFDELDEQTMATVWQACPGVATLLDLPWAASDEQAADRCRRYLGWIPGTAAPDPSGARVNQLELQAPAEQLRDLRFALGLTPVGLLDPATRQLATFDWLLAHAADTRDAHGGPHAWYLRHHALAERSADIVPAAIRATVQEHLDARTPPRGTESWAAVARVLLAAAVQHRWGDPAGRSRGLTALEEALPWAALLIRSDHALLTTLSISEL